MIMSEEQTIFKGKMEFELIETAVRQAVVEGQRIDLFEQDLWERMLRLGHKFMQSFVELQGNGDLGETFEYEGVLLKN